jgi:predicted ATP-dependent serine protease
LIESKKEDIKLLVVNNLTKFFKESKNKNHAASILKEVLGILCKVCARNKVALVCTGDANVTSKGIIPRPIGGTFLKHAVNVIVNLKESSNSHYSFKATLIKHQYVKTPKSAVLYTRKTGGMLLLD